MVNVPFSFWIIFTLAVIALLVVDLLVFHRESHKVSLTEATWWSIFWIGLALAFNVGIWLYAGAEAGATFLAGYLLEKSLSVDNLFVFSVLFSYFHIPNKYQHRVLFWGIFGALVMRAIMIFAGVALIREFEWLFYVFGAFLLITGVRMLTRGDTTPDPSENPVLNFLRSHLPVTETLHEEHFIVKLGNRRYVTPLFLVLVMIELTDLIFALDSIPAILGITQDPFIVYTSNIMAILGLRALYFVLAGAIDRFEYLEMGVSIVLIFIAIKMIAEQLGLHIPLVLSLGMIVGILLLSTVASVVKRRRTSEKVP
jgi:tellurite resistance protein TerC